MIKIIVGIIFIILIHMIIFVLYPDTGKYGHHFLYGSIALWSFLYTYITLNLKILSTLSIIIKILFFILIFLSITIITPQEDKKAILSKMMKKEFPDADTINRGKIKYLNGLFTDSIKNTSNMLEKETKKFIDKIKE